MSRISACYWANASEDELAAAAASQPQPAERRWKRKSLSPAGRRRQLCTDLESAVRPNPMEVFRAPTSTLWTRLPAVSITFAMRRDERSVG